MKWLIEWLAKSSVGSMFGMIPAKLIVISSAAVALLFAGGWVNGMRWESKYEKHIAADDKAVADAQEVARLASYSNAVKSARIDTLHFKELQNEKQKIADLRAGITAGTVRLRTTESHCNNSAASADTARSVGDGREPNGGAGGYAVEQDILTLAEYAKQAIAQRDYLKEKHALDLAALGLNSKEKK